MYFSKCLTILLNTRKLHSVAQKHLDFWNLIHHTGDIKILVLEPKPKNIVLTLTFKVQLLNEELNNTSSWIFVFGLSTTDLQETQWKFGLWK